jgi:hypothetical protein
MSFLALTQAHFQLSGGWRQNLLIVGVYIAATAALATLAYRTARPDEYGPVSAACLAAISLIQGILALLVAPGAVRKAVQRDFQTGMIESHRLTPLSGLSLVLGYLIGSTAQSVLLYATGLLLGGYFAGAYGQSFGFPGVALGGWYFSQICLSILALLIVALVLLTALATEGKTSLMVLLALFGVFGGPFIVPLVPGLALLTGAMSAGWLLTLLGRGRPLTGDPAALGWTMLLQTAMALTLLAAACRKVRAPNRPAFTIPLGLILLAVTGVALLLGTYYFPGYARIFRWEREDAWQWLGSSVAFMLVALIPLATSAVERARADRAASAVPRDTRLLPLLLTLATAIVMYWLLPWRLETRLEDQRLLVAAPLILAVALSFWTDYHLVYAAHARGKSPFWTLVISWLIQKVLPLAAEGSVVFLSEAFDRGDKPTWWLAGFSPIGTLLVVNEGGQPWPGLAFQAAFAVLATLLARASFRALGVGNRRPFAHHTSGE